MQMITFKMKCFVVKHRTNGRHFSMRNWGWLFVGILWSTGQLLAQAGVQYVKPKSENIRSNPGGERIGEIVSGTAVEVLERRPNWAKVQVTGWIWEKSLAQDSTWVDGFTVRASHILLQNEEDARGVVDELAKGASFDDLARRRSLDKASGEKGGDLGRFVRGDLLPEIDQVVFRLKVGQVSGIVKSSLGYHIIKRTE